MIHLRKNPFSETEIEIPFVEGENVKQLVDRALEANGYDLSENVLSHFQVLREGVLIDRDLWEYCKVSEKDSILLAPRIARGSGGQLFKQIALITIAVAATYFSAGAATPWAAGLIAAAGIGGSLLVNALIPPPTIGGSGIGGLESSFEKSQMYALTSQANGVKKFGAVPRVYGEHRIFPVVAANPYTEIEADPENGNLIQYFYAIYDFGYGPLEISDVRIGDTSISEYADANYRLVDLNKPSVDEGSWDESLHDKFEFYKGDSERDGTQVVLDKNSNDTGVQLFEYEAIRTASSKVNGADQEISLDFVCPTGLTAYATNGNTYNRTIELKVEFSKVNEDVWRPFNDLDYVYGFSVAGGSNVFSEKFVSIAPVDNSGSGSDVVYLGSKYSGNFQNLVSWTNIQSYSSWDGKNGSSGVYVDHDNNPSTSKVKLTRSDLSNFGYPIGTTKIALKDQTVDFSNGDSLYIQGNLVGIISHKTPSPWPGYSYYHLTEPTKNAYTLFVIQSLYYEKKPENKFSPVEEILWDSAIISDRSMDNKVIIKKRTLGAARITANTTNPYYATIKFKPKEKEQYKVRVTRVQSFSSYSYRVADKLNLASLSTRFDREPIITDKRHVFLEVRIRATNQLNGNISNLSGLAASILDVYDPATQTWSKQRTNNPAWVFCDLLTGSINKRAISKDRLHLPSILEWADFCDEIPLAPPTQAFILPRFTCNFVLDFDSTLQSLLNSVGAAAQASLNIVDGKYGVLIDRQRNIPVQIFTPRNSMGFSSQRGYDFNFHALKIRYIDPAKNWEVAEAMVYDQGHTEDTATEFDELSSFACTNFEQAWRFGRYMMAQARLRKETISLNVDFEHLVCTRGDYVQITQDVMRVGGTPARVKEITGPDTVRIDDAMDTLSGVSYAYVYRGLSGIKTDSCTVIDSDEFQLHGEMPEVGDLIIIGESGKVVFDCIVKSIVPSDDLTATLILVEKADDIYLAESSDVLPYYDPQLTLNVDSENAVPPKVEDLVVVNNTWRVVGGAYQYYISLDWDLPIGAAFETFEVYANNGLGYDLVDYTKNSFYEYVVDPKNLNVPHSFKILAVSSTGKKIPLIDAPSVSATPVKKITPPSNVQSLYMNITSQVIQLDWTEVTDSDLREYLIRYSPKTSGATWESSIPLLRVDKNTTLASTQARVGTYFIKAIDLNKNESVSAALALTTIPNLFDLNVIETTNDFPALEGELVTCVNESNSLMLKRLTSGGTLTNEYYSEGYYYYGQFLDLGEIYTVRLQSLIEAEGFTVGDLMENWPDLSTLSALSVAGRADWDVETHYRTTEGFNVMAEWGLLENVNPLSEGEQDDWTPWRKILTITDATGRLFQFRLKLISNVAHVTPRVFDGIIKADMPDRLETYNDLIASSTGLQINYSPAFKGPGLSPNIQITQDNAQSGDYYILENKTLEGFKITFYDRNGVPVIRQFDAAIKGYGRKALAVI
jgi:hypothetical protein